MDEDRKRKWDVILGIFGPVLTVAGIWVGVLQFNMGEDNRRKSEAEARLSQAQLEIQKDELEYRRRLWQERLTTYAEVAKLAGRIAATEAGSERNKAIADFEGAYWGAMVMVEDPGVEKAMQEVHYELAAMSPDPVRLKKLSDLLSQALRQSLAAHVPQSLTKP